VNKRAEKARQTRSRILAAAGELFVEQGYGATSLQEVADRAGVAVQTIYFVFGNKRALLKELFDLTIAGDDEPVATMDRPWFRDAMATETAEAHLRAHISGTREILERVAAITGVWTTALATDPELATMWAQDEDPRLVVHATAEYAADLLFGLLSPELFLVLVRDRGWSPETWEQWAGQTLRAQLCVSRGGSGT
jgi:AcrR family transcriptional regulator